MRIAKWAEIVGLAITLFLLVGLSHSAFAANVTGKYATFVADANTGQVLHAYKAEELRYPASLTKMMTLYIVFELIEDRSLSYNTMITASREAASRPPSKIGLQAGERITVRQAVKALITKSANDVAAAVAEHISGSERAFARRMTRKARLLGMTQTVFRNASGLPNARQVTTARDMAQLALRLRDHFPGHYHHFKTRSFRYRGRRFKNHNVLLGRYRGVDGIKTGYIRASGFNLVTSVRHNGRNIVAVVMGGRTGRARNAAMRNLLSKYVSSGSTVVTREPARRIALRRAPQLAVRRVAPSAPRITHKPEMAAVTGFEIQVGAFTTQNDAHRQLANVVAKAGALLSGLRPLAIRASSGQRKIYRARFAGYNSQRATSTCQKLKQLGIDCFVAKAQ